MRSIRPFPKRRTVRSDFSFLAKGAYMIYFGKDSAVKLEMRKWFDIRLVTKKWVKNNDRWNARKYFDSDFEQFEEDSPLGIVTFDRTDAMTSADYINA